MHQGPQQVEVALLLVAWQVFPLAIRRVALVHIIGRGAS